jgi:hypothetical protein
MPAAPHTEKAFEDLIEAHLLTSGGYQKGSSQAFDRALAIVKDDRSERAAVPLQEARARSLRGRR